jgi:hypothetical protein
VGTADPSVADLHGGKIGFKISVTPEKLPISVTCTSGKVNFLRNICYHYQTVTMIMVFVTTKERPTTW